MAEASKSSFLGSINPWSRTSTPPPRSPRQVPATEETLRPTSGTDHTTSPRPYPSLSKYPRDCPPIKTRWYYAVDVAKRKPFVPEPAADDAAKPKAGPRKWVLFSPSDSQAIEAAFQKLGRMDEHGEKVTTTRVPVNEDYLFDVHIEQRELEPAYWLGPVYEVRRGSWFFYEGSNLRPCEENLANQLEEGYIKVKPWKKAVPARSTAQPHSQSSVTSAKVTIPPPPVAVAEMPATNTYRLFGTHMNTTATYQDETVAYLSTDDFVSRVSSLAYGRFGGQSGTKVVRGFLDTASITDARTIDTSSTKDDDISTRNSTKRDTQVQDKVSPSKPEEMAAEQPHRPSALERQLSSLAGLTRSQTHDEQQREDEEEARMEEQKEMEAAREKDGEEQGRKIDHLILVTHGIGQRLGLRLDSINFVHDVNTMRKTMKNVFEASPDLQALAGDKKNCTVQVLPLCWRHLLDFPKQSLKNNRREHDLDDLDTSFEDEYPSLQDITVDGVPAVRNLITDLALDVLLYQSAYKEHVARIVQKEANRVYRLFQQRTGFQGQVSLCGHSLGSAVLFDILCRQKEEARKARPGQPGDRTSKSKVHEDEYLQLDFECDSFFALGSPIALFQMLKGCTIAARQPSGEYVPVTSPFDSDPVDGKDLPDLGSRPVRDLLPITTSSPKCAEFYNIFHPTDPIAYRIEPLISPAMSSLKPQALPYTKTGLFAAPGMANLTARVGQQVISGWYNLTSGVASTLINRSLGIAGADQTLTADKSKIQSSTALPTSDNAPVKKTSTSDNPKQHEVAAAVKDNKNDDMPTLIDSEMETLFDGFQRRRRSHGSNGSLNRSLEFQLEQDKARKLRKEEGKVRALNSNGRVDYHIQEGMFDVSLLASIASHLSYWSDADVSHFMVGQILKRSGDGPRTRRDTWSEDIVP